MLLTIVFKPYLKKCCL